MSEKILNAISRTELIDLQKEVDRTEYTHDDKVRFTQMIEDRLTEIE